MSGLFEKRADGSTRRNERKMKENKARRKRRTIVISVTSVMLLLFAAALVVNSNFISRTLPAISIGGHSFTAAEFDYFFNNAYQEYASWVQENVGDDEDYAKSLLPSTELPLSSQIHNAETGETWSDYFAQRAITNMSDLLLFYNAAEAAGFEIPPEGIMQIEDAVSSIMEEARNYVQNYPQQYSSPDGYLRAMFGTPLNERGLRDIMMFVQRAVTYGESMRNSFTFNQQELEDYYLANRDSLDVFSFRVLFIEPDYSDSEYYDSEDVYNADEDALEQASARAKEIAQGIETEEDFIAAALDYNADVYVSAASTRVDQMGEELDPDFAAWLMGEEPLAYGDITTIDYPYGTAIVYFISRSDNNYFTATMRQVLFLRDELSADSFAGGVDDPEYLALLEDLDIEASNRAQEVFSLFALGDASEARFLEMVDLYSDDNIEGGFYDGIAKYMFQGQSSYTLRVVEEIERWLFEQDRSYGDFELIRSEAYGYHLVYFSGHGERMRDIVAADRLSSVTFIEWSDSLPPVGEVEKHWAFMFTMV